MNDDPDGIEARVTALEIVVRHILTEIIPGTVLAECRDKALDFASQSEACLSDQVVMLPTPNTRLTQGECIAVSNLYNRALNIQWIQASEGNRPERLGGLTADGLLSD